MIVFNNSDSFMMPIFEALKQGERFSASLLIEHYDDCEAYWNWWWDQASFDQLSRPCIIQDGDHILVETESKHHADTASHFEYFNNFLTTAINKKLLDFRANILRHDFREKLKNMLVNSRSSQLENKTIIFAGGGYGAGKTTVISDAAMRNSLIMPSTSMVGVDYVKLYIPEYNIISRLGDGRASSIVQSEARLLSDQLFDVLLNEERSFIWDSSMSNKDETVIKLKRAISKGYNLEMIAVCSTVSDAIKKAMLRAKQSRRFANPNYLPSSHGKFSRAFKAYIPYFQDVKLFWNPFKASSILIAEKNKNNNVLDVFDDTLVNTFFEQGQHYE